MVSWKTAEQLIYSNSEYIYFVIWQIMVCKLCAKSPAPPEPNNALLKKLLLAYLPSENGICCEWISAAPRVCLQLTSAVSAFKVLILGLVRTGCSPELSRASRDVTGMSAGPHTLWHLKLSHCPVTLLSPSWCHPPVQTEQGWEKSPRAEMAKCCSNLECYRKPSPKEAEHITSWTLINAKKALQKAFYTNEVFHFLSCWDMMQLKPQHPFTCKLQ